MGKAALTPAQWRAGMFGMMSELARKVQLALDEARMLMLGVEVLIGFHMTAILEPGFGSLERVQKLALLGGAVMLFISCLLLVSTASHHRIVCAGRDRPVQTGYSTVVLSAALGPLAVALGLDLFVASSRIVGMQMGAVIGFIGAMTSIGLWYLWPLIARRGGASVDDSDRVKEEIRHVLTEARMVLPGVQALLGFAMVAVLMSGFEQLDRTLQLAHGVALVVIALAAATLVAPAAYHRIAERGESTVRFLRVASALVLIGLALLGIGFSIGLWIVTERITESRELGLGAGIGLLIAEYGLWFVFALVRRRQMDHVPERTPLTAEP
jgi:hypothetical protein